MRLLHKSLFLSLLVLATLSSRAQALYFQKNYTNWEYNYHRVDSGFRPPLDTIARAEVGSVANLNGRLYTKQSDKWVPMSSLDAGSVAGGITTSDTARWNNAVGSGVNIYNSNGTLLGDRIMDGGGNNLIFQNLGQFYLPEAGGGYTRLSSFEKTLNLSFQAGDQETDQAFLSLHDAFSSHPAISLGVNQDNATTGHRDSYLNLDLGKSVLTTSNTYSGVLSQASMTQTDSGFIFARTFPAAALLDFTLIGIPNNNPSDSITYNFLVIDQHGKVKQTTAILNSNNNTIYFSGTDFSGVGSTIDPYRLKNPPVTIYNSDGTLVGNRLVQTNFNTLKFLNPNGDGLTMYDNGSLKFTAADLGKPANYMIMNVGMSGSISQVDMKAVQQGHVGEFSMTPQFITSEVDYNVMEVVPTGINLGTSAAGGIAPVGLHVLTTSDSTNGKVKLDVVPIADGNESNLVISTDGIIKKGSFNGTYTSLVGLPDLSVYAAATQLTAKVNISDTANMLLPYQLKGDYQPAGSYATTTQVSTKLDTSATYITGIILQNNGLFHTSPATYNYNNHTATLTQTLANQQPYTLFGRAAGVGQPSALSSIDGNFISSLPGSKVTGAAGRVPFYNSRGFLTTSTNVTNDSTQLTIGGNIINYQSPIIVTNTATIASGKNIALFNGYYSNPDTINKLFSASNVGIWQHDSTNESRSFLNFYNAVGANLGYVGAQAHSNSSAPSGDLIFGVTDGVTAVESQMERLRLKSNGQVQLKTYAGTGIRALNVDAAGNLTTAATTGGGSGTAYTDFKEEFTSQTTTTKTLLHTPAYPAATLLFYNKVLQSSSQYSISGTTLTLNFTPTSTDTFTLKYSY